MHPASVAGLLAAASVVIATVAIIQHLRHYSAPAYQVHIVRILLMVPVYSVQSWLALAYPSYRVELGTLRDCYEAYVMYQFFSLLVVYLGGENTLIEYLDVKPNMRHPWPLTYRLHSIPMGRRFLRRVRQGILQFVLVRPVTAVLAVVMELLGVYREGNLSMSSGFLYLSMVNNVSVSVSLYCLILFYMATQTRLEPFKPLPKFMCIKAVLFFSFWQSCALALLVWFGVLRNIPITEASMDDAGTLQDFFICVEMVLAAVGHHYAFSYTEFQDARKSRQPLLTNLFDVLDVQDVLDDAHSSFLDEEDRSRTTEMSDMTKGSPA